MFQSELVKREQKLLEGEKALIRDRKEWKQQKTNLERDIIVLEATKETALKEIAKHHKEIEQLSKEQTEMATELHAGLDKKEMLENDAAQVRLDIKKATEELTDLLKTIDDKKANAESEVAKHREQQEDILEGTKESIAEANKVLSEINDTILKSQENLTNITTKLEVKQKDFQDFVKQTEIDKETMRQDASVFAEMRDALVSIILFLIVVYSLVQRETEIEHHKHVAFVDYEKRAWITLRAKDESLQEREDELKRQEVLIKNRRSFLPSS